MEAGVVMTSFLSAAVQEMGRVCRPPAPREARPTRFGIATGETVACGAIRKVAVLDRSEHGEPRFLQAVPLLTRRRQPGLPTRTWRVAPPSVVAWTEPRGSSWCAVFHHRRRVEAIGGPLTFRLHTRAVERKMQQSATLSKWEAPTDTLLIGSSVSWGGAVTTPSDFLINPNPTDTATENL